MAKTQTKKQRHPPPQGKKVATATAGRRRKRGKGQKTKVAFIGAGGMANSVHYPSLASFDDVEIAAICDLNSERLNATADQYGVERRYTNYAQMVADVAPDAVYAIGQPHLMYDIWTWCLNQGLNLCIEKPMGLSMHQARALLYLAEKHQCITQVSFQRRSCPMVVQLRDECLKRGPITHGVCKFYKWLPTPMLGARDHMMDDTVHAIDTLRWICGGEVVRQESIAKRVGTPNLNFFAVLMEFDNGATGVLLNSWTSGKRIFSVEMHAPGIFVEAEHEDKGIVYSDGNTQGVVYDTKEVAGSDQNYVYGGFCAKNREFIDAVQQKTLPASHFGDAIKTMEVAERILADHLLR